MKKKVKKPKEVHSNKQSIEETKQCELCNKRYQTQSGLRRHMKNCHEALPVDTTDIDVLETLPSGTHILIVNEDSGV